MLRFVLLAACVAASLVLLIAACNADVVEGCLAGPCSLGAGGDAGGDAGGAGGNG